MNDIQRMNGEFKDPIIDGERATIEPKGACFYIYKLWYGVSVIY